MTENKKLSFGTRLAKLRHEAGYSQRAFAKEIGISQRMVAYYEAQSKRPPAHLLLVLAKTLGISVDDLLDLKKDFKQKINRKILKKIQMIEHLPSRQRQAIFEHIEALFKEHGK